MSKQLTKEEKRKRLRLLTPKFRVSYPHLLVPSAIKNTAKKQYSIEMIFDKEVEGFDKLLTAVKFAIVDKWGKDKDNWPSPLRRPYRDGDKPKKNKQTGEMEVRPEHEGMWVVKASSNADGFSKPQILDRQKNPITDQSVIYPGCYARASITAHAYEFSETATGVKFLLNGVQFIEDGEPLGGSDAANDFDVLDDAGDDTGFNAQSEDDENLEDAFM